MANFADDTDVSALENETPVEENTPVYDEDPQEVDEVSEASDEQVADEPEVEEEVAPSTQSGPTPAMLEVAKSWLPQQLVSLARDDKQLQEMVELARNQQPVAEQEEDFELTLPDDEYEVDNAVRKQFKSMADHYKKANSGLKSDIADLVGVVSSLQGEQKEIVKFRQLQEQKSFDRALDSTESDQFGKFGKMSKVQTAMRSTAYDLAKEIQAEKGGDLEEIALQIANEMSPGLKDKKTQQANARAIREQSNGRLGHGGSKRLPEPEATKDQRFDSFLEKLTKQANI